MSDQAPADAALQAKISRLIAPLSPTHRFAKGWSVGRIYAEGDFSCVEIVHDVRPAFVARIAKLGTGPSFAKTAHFEVSYDTAEISPHQQEALRALVRAILTNGF